MFSILAPVWNSGDYFEKQIFKILFFLPVWVMIIKKNIIAPESHLFSILVEANKKLYFIPVQ